MFAGMLGASLFLCLEGVNRHSAAMGDDGARAPLSDRGCVSAGEPLVPQEVTASGVYFSLASESFCLAGESSWPFKSKASSLCPPPVQGERTGQWLPRGGASLSTFTPTQFLSNLAPSQF